jgi:hypothetical protein
MKQEEEDNLLAAVVRLIHNDLIKDPKGDHYTELVSALLAATCLIPLDEVSTALTALENAAETLHRTPLLPFTTRMKLLEVAQEVNLNPSLKHLRD